MNATTTEFDWQATESAPINYPMQIIDGTFFYHEQQNGLYIPSGGTLYDGWGKMISSHVVGDDLKPLLDRLEITFFSYTENVFYQGTFDLPYEKILALFNAGYFSPREKGDTTYEGIMCGIAPGGTVVVWLLGIDEITEVFTGQANKIEANEKLNDVIPPELVKMELENEDSIEPGVLTSMREKGIPFANWATQFRTKYKWVPTFVTENSPKEINPIFY